MNETPTSTSRFLDIQQLIAALDKEGVKSSPRTVDRWCAKGMPYWLVTNRKRFKLESTVFWLEKGFRRERNPEQPRRRGRPRRAA